MFTRTEPECVTNLYVTPTCPTDLSTRDNKGHGDRDVFNEKPTREEQTLASAREPTNKASPVAHSAVIHTTFGDMHLKLFPQQAPKAVENFVGHARSGYFEGILFHRVIQKFVRAFPDQY